MMSTNDRDSRMMDYLYDEMDPSARADFERELHDDPSLQAEVDSLSGLRSMLHDAVDLDVGEAPPLMMQDIMRQARLAADSTPQRSWVTRVIGFMTTPAFAVGALAVTALAIGGIYSPTNRSAPTEPSSEGLSVATLKTPTAAKSMDDETDSALAASAPTATATSYQRDPLSSTLKDAEGRIALADAPREAQLHGSRGERAAVAAAPTSAAEIAEESNVAEIAATAPSIAIGSGTSRNAPTAKDVPSRRQRLSKAKRKSTAQDERAKSIQRHQIQTVIPSAPIEAVAAAEPSASARGPYAKRSLEDGGIDASVTAYGRLASQTQVGRTRKPAAVVASGATGSAKGAPPADALERNIGSDAPAKKAELPAVNSAADGLADAVVKPEQEPASLDSYRKAGVSHFGQQRFDLALRNLQRYVDGRGRKGVSVALKQNLAKSYERTNQTKRALVEYERLLKEHPSYKHRAAVLIEVALLHAKLGNLSRSKALLREASKDRTVATRARAQLERIDAKLETRRLRQRAKAAKKARTKTSKRYKASKQAPASKKKAATSGAKGYPLERD